MKEEYIIVNVKNTVFTKRFIGMKCVKVNIQDKTLYLGPPVGPPEGKELFHIESEDQYLNLAEHNVRKLTKLDKALE